MGVTEGIVTQIEAGDSRIDLRPGIFIGSVGQLRIGRAFGDRFEKVLFSLQSPRSGFVAVFDRPAIVGAHEGGEIVALGHSRRGEVGKDVVHHRGNRALGTGNAWVVEFFGTQQGAAVEVVAQSQSMPHFMGS